MLQFICAPKLQYVFVYLDTNNSVCSREARMSSSSSLLRGSLTALRKPRLLKYVEDFAAKGWEFSGKRF